MKATFCGLPQEPENVLKCLFYGYIPCLRSKLWDSKLVTLNADTNLFCWHLATTLYLAPFFYAWFFVLFDHAQCYVGSCEDVFWRDALRLGGNGSVMVTTDTAMFLCSNYWLHAVSSLYWWLSLTATSCLSGAHPQRKRTWSLEKGFLVPHKFHIAFSLPMITIDYRLRYMPFIYHIKATLNALHYPHRKA